MSISAGSPRFRLAVVVRPEHLDELEHVNNAVYLRWVQDAAVAHWHALAPAELQGETFWVVVRYEIDYKVPAVEGDQLQVETWVGTSTRATFERHTEITRGSNRELLVKARTLWCPIHPRTRRPVRVDARIRALFSVPESPE